MPSSCMTQVPSPAVTSLSSQPCNDSLRRWDSLHSCGTSSWVKFGQYSRSLPQKNARRPAQGGRPLRTLARTDASARWNVDDVERLSRGRPSKSKMGSRAVPHRLNAEERKAFELAKKRGYVVQQVNSRWYPLVNTYHNYCDALGLPCIRIEQGPAGSTDQVVIDLTPLHLSEARLFTLRDKVSTAIKAMSASNNEETATSELVSKDNKNSVQVWEQNDSSLPNTRVESIMKASVADHLQEPILSNDLGLSQPLRLQASTRSMTKVICQTVLDTWRRMSRTKAGELIT